MCSPLSKREEIISVAAQNCVNNFVQGGELLSVAVYCMGGSLVWPDPILHRGKRSGTWP